MTIANVIALLSGVALFLFGMNLMGDGMKKVAGNRLELVLYRLSSTPLKGILLGTGVTAVIQSSSATSVMVVGFVNSGMMQLRQAIGIIMGSLIGTSITGWIICLSEVGGGSGWLSLVSTDTLTGILAVIGIVLYMFCKKPARSHLGSILLGFAVLMFGIGAMSDSVAPLRESEAFLSLMTRFSNPVLGLLVGLVMTAILQSASSAVGILQALAVTGAIDFSIAFPIILGIAIGAAVPVLLCAIGASAEAKRSAMAYLLASAAGVVLVGGLFYILNALFPFPYMERTLTTVGISLVNTVFRAAAVALQMPFIGVMEKLLCRMIRDRAKDPDMVIAPLEERFLKNPDLAVAHSRDAVLAMAAAAQKNLLASMDLLRNYSEEGFLRVQEMEHVVDLYEDKLGAYLVRITSSELNGEQTTAVSKYLHTIGDLERISDHAVNISEVAQEMWEKQTSFTPDALRELTVIGDAVAEIVALSIAAFTDDDLDRAYRVEPLEELIDNLCDELKLHHIERLQQGLCTLTNGFVFNDLVTNYERVSDHCSNIAVAMIELDSVSFDAHEYIDSVKELHAGMFNRCYDEYSARFSL